MAITDIQRLGLPCSDAAAAFYIADSGVTALTTTPQTITATIPTIFDGSQPIVRQGWMMLEISGLASSSAVGVITITVDDGTHTVKILTLPASTTAVANQGLNYLTPIFVTLSDSLTTIMNINAICAFTTANVGNVRVYFNGSN